ncbi:hypothetical protein E2C01_096305 [Portunus trituberculatus]|uniref:Uncharacterized protein n=1 Tax=Portunus trituberculatus TaxID=210409 RepID=A0A5B7K7W3_PORTR|nr:hypothetical protein [Portunus trituberculatus]
MIVPWVTFALLCFGTGHGWTADDLSTVLLPIYTERHINVITKHKQNTESESILLVTPDEVRRVLRRMRPGKDEGEGDHLLHADDVLFLSMLKHGFSPQDSLKGVMVPLPKGEKMV